MSQVRDKTRIWIYRSGVSEAKFKGNNNAIGPARTRHNAYISWIFQHLALASRSPTISSIHICNSDSVVSIWSPWIARYSRLFENGFLFKAISLSLFLSEERERKIQTLKETASRRKIVDFKNHTEIGDEDFSRNYIFQNYTLKNLKTFALSKTLPIYLHSLVSIIV